MTKRIMRAFRMDEISAVDRPAQAHAKAVIMKRMPFQKDMYGVSRFADVICSIGYLAQCAENEAEIEGDGSPIPATLRAWLKSGGEIFLRMADEEINELIGAAVRKSEEGDVEAYLKRNYLDELEKRDFTAEQRRDAASSGAALPDGSFPIENAEDLHNAMRAIGRAKDKAKAKAHIKARAKALGLSNELSDAFKSEHGLLAKLAEFFSNAAATGSVVDPVIPTDKEIEMTPAVKKALGLTETATEEEVLKAIAKRDSELEIAKAGMTDDEKEYHDGLDGADAKAKFRGMSKEERAKAMKKREVELPPDIVKRLAENDDLKKRLAALEEKDEKVQFAKKAAGLGLAEEKGEVLRKAAAGDKTAMEEVFKMLGDANAALEQGSTFAEFGSAVAKSADVDDELMAKANELRKKDPNLTIEQAYAKVYTDPANAVLAKRERREHRPA